MLQDSITTLTPYKRGAGAFGDPEDGGASQGIFVTSLV